jgi:hypothetical protein
VSRTNSRRPLCIFFDGNPTIAEVIGWPAVRYGLKKSGSSRVCRTRKLASRVERLVTYVGLEIIRKLSVILKADPAEFFSEAKPIGLQEEDGLAARCPGRPADFY